MNPLSRAQRTHAIRAAQDDGVAQPEKQPAAEDETLPGQLSPDEERVNQAIALHLMQKARQKDDEERAAKQTSAPSGGPRPGVLARLARWLNLR